MQLGIFAKTFARSSLGEVIAAGRGELDYDRYLENLRGVGFEGPVILHGLGESEVEGSVAFLRAKLVNSAYS